MSEDHPDHDAIITAVANGVAIRKVAASHGLTTSEVNKIIDDAAEHAFGGEALRRDLFIEKNRLNTIALKYYERGISNAPDARECALTYIKANERLSCLVGLNAVQGHAVAVIHQQVPVERKNSTEKIRDALDAVIGIGSRERFLLDKMDEIDGPGITAEEAAEIDELRKARGRGPRGEDPLA
jgi:hypothetical protein